VTSPATSHSATACPASPSAAPSRLSVWRLQARYAPYLFVAPFVLLFCIFLLYPLLQSIVLSLFDTAGPRARRFIGLGNYAFLLRDKLFWAAVLNTAYYTVCFLAVQIPASLGLALLLNSPRVRFRNALRFAFFSAHLVGHVFVAVLFAMLLSPRQGLLNRAIELLVGHPVEIDWLGDPDLAMPSILLAAWWISIGYGMIYFLAALQAVDRELYEAAEVDGAGRWATFWHVTLPGIRPVLVFLVVVGSIGAFQLFELPWVLFGHGTGPNGRAMTIVGYLFISGWEMGNFGYAAAVGWMLFLFIAAVTLVQVRAMRVLGEEV
jgi:ABC-type sugar transport system permease subunit